MDLQETVIVTLFDHVYNFFPSKQFLTQPCSSDAAYLVNSFNFQNVLHLQTSDIFLHTGCYCSSAAVSVCIDLDAQLVLFPSRVSILGHTTELLTVKLMYCCCWNIHVEKSTLIVITFYCQGCQTHHKCIQLTPHSKHHRCRTKIGTRCRCGVSQCPSYLIGNPISS